MTTKGFDIKGDIIRERNQPSQLRIDLFCDPFSWRNNGRTAAPFSVHLNIVVIIIISVKLILHRKLRGFDTMQSAETYLHGIKMMTTKVNYKIAGTKGFDAVVGTPRACLICLHPNHLLLYYSRDVVTSDLQLFPLLFGKGIIDPCVKVMS